jgi:hypothetical protein
MMPRGRGKSCRLPATLPLRHSGIPPFRHCSASPCRPPSPTIRNLDDATPLLSSRFDYRRNRFFHTAPPIIFRSFPLHCVGHAPAPAPALSHPHTPHRSCRDSCSAHSPSPFPFPLSPFPFPLSHPHPCPNPVLGAHAAGILLPRPLPQGRAGRSAHCTLHTAHCTLQTADCRLRTADCGLHTAHCTALSACP